MARNIAQNGALTPRMAGTLRSDDQNIKRSNANRNRNRFDMSYQNLMSLRFGEVRPFYYQQVINDDTQIFSNSSELWTMQMKSPLMSNFVGYKDYFYVPMKCILPNSWDAWKNNPLQEDDIPDDAYCNFDLGIFFYHSNVYFQNIHTLVGSYPSTGNSDTSHRYFASFYLLYHILSCNSLLNQLGININTIYSPYYGPGRSFYRTSDSSVPSIDESLEFLFSMGLDVDSGPSDTISIGFSSSSSQQFQFDVWTKSSGNHYDFNVSAFRELLESYRYAVESYGLSSITFDSNSSTYFGVLSLLNVFYLLTSNVLLNERGYLFTFSSGLTPSGNPASTPFFVDISPLIAYQMVGSQFYVNDLVDKIYTSSDWLDNFISPYSSEDTQSYIPDYYDYNGHNVQYDVMSWHSLSKVLSAYVSSVYSRWNESPEVSGDWYSSFMSLYNLFVPFDSLRYGDYFTGSRLNPLALGADPNSYAPVVSDEVQSLDMVQAMSYLNYYNDVNKIGATAWIQENGIYGSFPQSLDPMPRFISRSKFSIGEMQIENTSDTDTGNIVTRGRSNDSSDGFAIDITESAIILGLVSFDCPRIYQNVSDRLSFVKNRFDIFNPYFQNIGDQPVLNKEISLSGSNFGFVLSWQIRNTEYKQRLSVASGAFVGSYFLPSWAFVVDNRYFRLNSWYIRNHNSSFDKFFVNLPNVTNAGYFHFYVRFFNRAISIRAMQDKPDIQTPKIHQ